MVFGSTLESQQWFTASEVFTCHQFLGSLCFTVHCGECFTLVHCVWWASATFHVTAGGLQRGLVIPVIPSEKPGEFQHGASPEFALVLQRNDPQWSHLAILAWKRDHTKSAPSRNMLKRHLWAIFGPLKMIGKEWKRIEEIGKVSACTSMPLKCDTKCCHAAALLSHLRELCRLRIFTHWPHSNMSESRPQLGADLPIFEWQH